MLTEYSFFAKSYCKKCQIMAQYMYYIYWGCQNLKKCKVCNAQMPDEASFCLSCSSAQNCCEEPDSKKPKVFLHKKYVTLCISLLFILSLSLATAARIKNISLRPHSDTPETVLVPVTEENGETVTDSQGDTVFEAVTVETTTKKQTIIGIIGDLIGVDRDEDKEIPTSESAAKPSATTPPTLNPSSVNSSETKPSETEPSQHEPTETESTQPGPTETKPSEPDPPAKYENPAEVFEFAPYSSNKSYLSITKYKGNAEHVVIPASHNGQYIVEIKKNTFQDNNKVKIVSFDDGNPYLWINSNCFNNCPNLHTINMPDTDLGIINNFAAKCYAMKTIVLKNNQYRFENGGLYYNTGRQWELRYCCPASIPDTLTLPLWCSGIEGACNLSELSKLKVINCHEYVTSFPDQTNLPDNLEAIYVDDKNTNGYDINGIAFQLNSNSKYYCIYPPKNATKDFTLPNNSFLFTAYVKNPYLETLRIEKTAELQSPIYISRKWAFKNLKTIYIKSGHKNEADIKKEFYGTVNTY